MSAPFLSFNETLMCNKSRRSSPRQLKSMKRVKFWIFQWFRNLLLKIVNFKNMKRRVKHV